MLRCGWHVKGLASPSWTVLTSSRRCGRRREPRRRASPPTWEGFPARTGAGEGALAVIADLEGFAGATAAVERARARFGRIDILVNNVGGTIWAKPFAQYEEAQIEAEIRRSLFPTLWCCRAVLPVMLEGGGGVIVNVSSVATRGVNRVPYAAAKGGVNAITACLAFEYAEHGIRVCGVAPGATEE